MNLTPATVAKAKLPSAYVEAKAALDKCVRLDECKDWAKKAEALASYARQANDDTLWKMATRIQGRAQRRCGELLKKFDAQGKRTDKPRTAPGTKSKTEAATDAGLSKRQKDNAVKTANIPEAEFEAAIESDKPPSATKLAEMGTKSDRKGFSQATKLLGTVRRFGQFCEGNDPVEVAGGVLPHEADDLRKTVSQIDHWLDRFVVNLEGSDEHRAAKPRNRKGRRAPGK